VVIGELTFFLGDSATTFISMSLPSLHTPTFYANSLLLTGMSGTPAFGPGLEKMSTGGLGAPAAGATPAAGAGPTPGLVDDQVGPAQASGETPPRGRLADGDRGFARTGSCGNVGGNFAGGGGLLDLEETPPLEGPAIGCGAAPRVPEAAAEV